MASESNFGLTLVYPKSLSEESNMRLNRNETYISDEKVNQYVLQNNRLKNVIFCNQFPMK